MSAQNLETLAKRYVELKSRIADLQEEADGLKAELMENREPGEYAAGPLTVKIRGFTLPFPFQGRTSPSKSNNRLRTIHKFASANSVTICPVFFLSPR